MNENNESRVLLNQILKEMSDMKKSLTHDDRPFLSIDDASSYLCISKNTIYQFTSGGNIPFFKCGRKLFFAKSDLDQWVLDKSKRHKSNSEIAREAAVKLKNIK